MSPTATASPISLGPATALGLAVCARAVGAGAALLADVEAQKYVALWAGTGSALEISSDFEENFPAEAGQVPITAGLSSLPAEILVALDFAPGSAWSSEVLVVGQRRYRLRLVWRRPPQGPLMVVETAAVFRALLMADRDRACVGALHTRLLTVGRIALLGKVAAAAGHDFNNLLGKIIGCAELVLDRVTGNAQTCSELELLMSTTEQGAGIVRRLSALTALPIAEPVPFDLLPLLEDYASRQVGLSLMANQSSVIVDADPMIVLAMIAAVVEDARERGGTRIKLTAASLREDSQVEITVHDDGREPTAALSGPLSDRFYTTGAGLMAGLGSDFVRAAVAESRGRLELSSASGSVTVRLILPGQASDLSCRSATTPCTHL